MKIIKVTVLTFHRAINYGAVWQCFALTNYLKSEGFDVSVIDFFPQFLKKYHYRLPKNPFNFVIKLLIIPQFRRFVRQKLSLTRIYNDKVALMQNPPDCDICICGSDQIWNKKIAGNELSVFLLDFVNKKSLKIAYSASIGGSEINKEDTNVFIENLKTFTAISVREKIAQNEVYKLIGVRPELVLDPTLLMDKDFYIKQISSRFKNKDYILIIDLEKNPLLQGCANHFKQNTKLPIMNISGAYYHYAINPLSVSPEDWISAIYHAKFVCVNSFHGLVFSILFEKNFYFVDKNNQSGNNRAIDLLELIGLSDRFICNLESVKLIESIDYSQVNIKLNNAREKSRAFLKKELKK